MVDNIYLGLEATVNHSLALLREAAFDKTIEAAVAVAAGVFLSVDPEADVRGQLSSTPGELLTLHLQAARPPRWIGLHFQMGTADFSDRQMLGVVCRSVAPKAGIFRVCLRSGTEDGFHDVFFRKTVAAYAEPSIHLDVLEFAREPAMPRAATWRELVLFFQPETTDVSLLDFHAFVI